MTTMPSLKQFQIDRLAQRRLSTKIIRRRREPAELQPRKKALLSISELQQTAYENPIQRPPPATPNHRPNDMSAANRPTSGRSEVIPDCVTRRRTVKVKMSTRNNDVIFTQKA
jgi:hypothetical protein